VENQATDRAHRLGQDKPVFVHRLIAAGTVEERIRALQSRKADLARGILDENAALAKALTAEDFQALFEPLAE
jgi:SNF2 family DNA or RNA helicase